VAARVLLRSFAFAVIVAATASTGQSAAGAASPLDPVQLSSAPAALGASAPQVALDGSGDGFAVWVESRPSGPVTMASLEPAGGAWSRASPLASGSVARLAVDPRGDAIVAGLAVGKSTQIFAVYRSADAGFGPPRLISGPTPGATVSVAIDDSGDALVSWSDGRRVHVATRARGHVWAERVLGEGGNPAVAADGRGDALVVWHVPGNADGHFVGAWKLRGGNWQRPRAVPLPGSKLAWPSAPQLALDARGDATAVFAVWSGDARYDTYLEAATARRGQPFGTPQQIGEGYDGVWPRLAVAPGGAAAVVYVDGRSEGSLWVTTRRAAGATFGAAVPLSEQTDILEPAVAITPGGRVLALWTQSDDGIPRPQLSLAGAAGAASGGFGAPLPFGEVGGDCFEHRCLHGGAASVALTPAGRVAVAWAEKPDPDASSGGIVVAATSTLAEIGSAA
jgi:hypothetical protein